MARRVFFTFHYQNDIFRVNTVRNHWLTKRGHADAGYWDHSLWEETKARGDRALARLIDSGLTGTSVTAILIGAETAGRPWVNYEIQRSHELGKGIIGVYIHQIRCAGTLRVDARGHNPLDDFYIEDEDGDRTYLSDIYPTYDWVDDDGYNYFSDWVETAAQEAGR
jgi:hypothetical protein